VPGWDKGLPGYPAIGLRLDVRAIRLPITATGTGPTSPGSHVPYPGRAAETTSGCTNMSSRLPMAVGLSPDNRLKSCTMCI